ncbi:sporulation protein [Vibrio astriarenae]|uniref:Sporulation protein n=1 Tax=Vibrio astriarenae TaxID=1481923 RepID=A0A7Z2YCC3_9VIBR|nr:sporulation protein [Vibrio astriarenae]QIA62101.1 sporulation protein [Vibrio astriarenae]
MSFLKKTLASFGIGSAKVDTVLQQNVLFPGQPVELKIFVYGGGTEQDIDNIDVDLCCQYVAEEAVERGSHGGDSMRTRRVKRPYVLGHWQLPYAFTIHPGETREFDVSIEVPWNTPVTVGESKVWLETGLDISHAIDPTDKDMLTVRPDPLTEGVFSALEAQGLRIRQVECEETKGFSLPFVQEFEFVPTTGPYHGRWRELEIVANRTSEELELWLEVDRNKSGMKGMMASLLGGGKLKRHMLLSSQLTSEQAGQQVLEYLETHC